MENDAALSSTSSSGDIRRGNEPIHTYEFNEAILSSKVMLGAYAIAVVVLAFGLVILTIMLAYLCFWYPEKANAFLLLIGGPMATVLIAHVLQLPKLTKRVTLIKQDSESV